MKLRTALGLAALVLTLAAQARADFPAVCKRCGRPFTAPGGSALPNPGGGGMPRLIDPECLSTDEDRCRYASTLAEQCKTLYRRYLAQLRDATTVAEQMPILTELYQLRAVFEELKAECPERVRGEVGPAIELPGAPEPGPVSGAPDAEQDARSRERAAAREQEELDVIQGFCAATGSSFGPVVIPTGWNGERQRAVSAERAMIEATRARAERARAGKAPEEPRFAEAVEAPKLAKLTIAPELSPLEQRAGDAVYNRRLADAWDAAHEAARTRFEAAEAKGDAAAAALQAKAMLEFSYMAEGNATAAAEKQLGVDREVQRSLDAALEEAAKKGVELGQVLAAFQAGLAKDGLPPALRGPFEQAGLPPQELEAYRKRLSELTPERVTACLEARRKRLRAEAGLAPEPAVLLRNQVAARRLYRERNKPGK